jgi:hypothetical protein
VTEAPGSGIAKIALSCHAQLKDPVPWFLYSSEKVTVLPGVSPLMTLVAVERCCAEPARISAVESVVGVTPLIEKLAIHAVELAFPVAWAVTPTNTSPDAGTVTVTDGPGDPVRGA